MADWVEAVMLIEGRHTLSYSEVRSRLTESGEPEADSDVLQPTDAQDEFAPIDNLDLYQAEIETVFLEMQTRATAAPIVYPFRRTSWGIQRIHNDWVWAYGFLLLLSFVEVEFRSESYSNKISRLFDWLCGYACQQYLGGAAMRRFGWPPLGDGRPGRPLSKAIQWITEEAQAGLAFNSGVKTLPKENDAGVDLILWRAFHDKRSGYSLMLVQCTVARDFEKKSKDIDEKFWTAILGMQAEPITALALPYAIPEADEDDWLRACRRMQVLLDRLRLCELLESADPGRAPFRDEIGIWVQLKLDQLSYRPASV